MGKDSAFNKEKDRNYRLKLEAMKKDLPVYMYEFLDSKAQRNPNTAVAYAYDLELFFAYLKEFNPVAGNSEIKDISMELLDSLTYQDINEYQKYLSAKDVTVVGSANLQNNENGIARRMPALSSFYKYQCERHELNNDPTLRANKPKNKDGDHVIVRMTSREVNDFLDTIENL